MAPRTTGALGCRPRSATIALRAIATLAVAGCLAGGVLLPQSDERAAAARVVATTGELSMSNSAGAGAILAAEEMSPGSTVHGTVTIANTGDLDGQLLLDASLLDDAAGRGGSPLSARLQLAIDDVTDSATPVRVYSGNLPGLRSLPVGAFAAGAGRSFRFAATLPEGGAGDDAYQGARTTVRFGWTATAEQPEAGMTSGGSRGRAPLRIPRGQRPLRNGAISVLTRCGSPCRARLTLSLPASRGAHRHVSRVVRKLPAGTGRIKLRLSRRSITEIRKRLSAGGSVRGRMTLTLREQSGRRLRTSRSVRFVLMRR